MVDKERFVGAVRQWTLTPLVETIKAPCSPGGPMVEVEQRTGLARALGVEDLVTTPTDTAALAALFRAVVRPPAAARESMRRAHVEEDYVPKTQAGWWRSSALAPLASAPSSSGACTSVRPCLSVFAMLAIGLASRLHSWPPLTIWLGHQPSGSDTTHDTEDDATKEDFGALYILRRNDPTFRLVLQHDPKARAALHLERFLGLRVSLAAVDPAIDRVTDATLLALLMVVLGGPARTVAERFATVALMKHHPERPPGHGQDYHYHRVPSEIQEWATPRPDRWAGAPIVRGLLVPSNEGDRARPAAVRAMGAIDALHNSSV